MTKTILNFGLFVALGLTTTLCGSCKKDGSNGGGGSGSTSKITATNVIGGTSQIVTVKAIVYWDSGDDYSRDVIAQVPYTDNGFTLELPATLADKYLWRVDEDEWDMDVYISDKNAKVYFWDNIEGYNIDENRIGSFYWKKEDDNSEHYTLRGYADKNVTIKGEFYEIDKKYNEEYAEKIDLSLKKGWNFVYASYVDRYDSSTGRDVFTFTLTSKKPSGVNYKWYFYGRYDDWSANFATKSVFAKLKEGRRK
jgi:hypothetical protein